MSDVKTFNPSTLDVVVLDKQSLSCDQLDFSALDDQFANVTYYDHSEPHEVAERIAAADVVFSNKAIVSRSAMQGAKQLKIVSVLATGYNNVDIAAAQELGITVSNIAGYGTPSIAQHVLMLMLMLATHYKDYQRLIEQGAWQRSKTFCLLDYPIMELSGKTLGIVGYGELGQAVGLLGSALGMRIIIAERRGATEVRAGRVALDEVIRTSDVISLHCPLTEDTKNLINATSLADMKPSALLINAARGGVVEESALKDALINGVIAGAATDVLSAEPPRDGNILLDAEIPNLIVTPHIAWAALEAQQRAFNLAVGNVTNFCSGEPSNVVS